jgi:hypothetical protein
VGGASAVAAAFMRAVADSNFTQMGALWGTGRGPAATTNSPSNWAQRIAVMHSYLKGGTARVLSEADPSLTRDDRREVLVELTRGGCVKTVPFTMIRTRDGSWLVNAVDLNAAGVPGRPCATPPAATPPPPPPSFGELDEDAGGGFRVEKSDPPAAGSTAGDRVDQPVAGRGGAGQGAVQVVDPVADVMDARPAARQEPGDGAVRRDRLEQLDVGVGEAEGRDAGPVLLLGLAVRLDREHVAVERERFAEADDGDADMGDLGWVSHVISS